MYISQNLISRISEELKRKKETTLRFYLTLVRMTKINKTVDKKYQRAGVEKGSLVLYR